MFSYLRCLNGYFYFRMRVPADIEQQLGRREIQKTLRTNNSKIARQDVKSLASKAEKLFRLIRSGVLTPEQIADHIESQFPSKNDRIAIVKPKLLSEVIEAYSQEHVLLGKWNEKTKHEVESCLKVFIELISDRPVNCLDRKAMVGFLDKVSRLPANMNKKAEYREKTVLQILEMKDVEPMSTSTVNKYLIRASSLLLWCVRQGYIDRNPAEGLTISKTTKEEDERSAYSVDDLKHLMVNLPPYPSEQPERYFVPLISMYSGARLNEICQMYVEDIKEVEGIWCFDINDEKDKRLKTISSRRVIPVHPKLVELGFMGYVEHIKKSGLPRLWMNLEYEREGYSHKFGKWFQYHNRKHITGDPKKCFHSFRHLVCDTLKQAGVEVSVISELVGHAHKGNITLSRYGKRYRPQILLDALMKLDY